MIGMKRDVRKVAVAEAKKILRVSIRFLEPRLTPGEEEQALDRIMRAWVLPSTALREPVCE